MVPTCLALHPYALNYGPCLIACDGTQAIAQSRTLYEAIEVDLETRTARQPPNGKRLLELNRLYICCLIHGSGEICTASCYLLFDTWTG